MSQAEHDRRWRERHPEKAKESNRAKCQRYKSQPEIREMQAIKRVARYHGISLEEAKERREAFRRRHSRDVDQISRERWA